MNRPRLLIVDDHEIVIEGLVRLLGIHRAGGKAERVGLGAQPADAAA